MLSNLQVKLLGPSGKAPLCAHPGWDLGYDLFCSRGVYLEPGKVTQVHTDIAVSLCGKGFLIRDRSSMAAKGIMTSGGVIDAGYQGEIVVLMTLLGGTGAHYISVGDRIAQLIPITPKTIFEPEIVSELPSSSRGIGGV